MDKAVALFEQAIGRTLTPHTVTERINVNSTSIGRITGRPVLRVTSVKAKASKHAYSQWLGATDWTDIPVNQISFGEREGDVLLRLPASIFGTPFDQALIEYVVGHEEMPDDALTVIEEIADLLKTTKDDYAVIGRLSDRSRQIIQAYKGV